MGHHEYSPTDELRSSSRFTKDPASDYASIWYPEEAATAAEVHNESLGGIALVVGDVSHLAIGGEVGIAHVGLLMRAIVRHIQPRPDGRYVVGFECELLLD